MGFKEKIRKSKVVGKVKQVHRPKKEKSNVRKDNSKRIAFLFGL